MFQPFLFDTRHASSEQHSQNGGKIGTGEQEQMPEINQLLQSSNLLPQTTESGSVSP
ncbi:MAG: hypothetical protein AB7T07_13930 [Steroidobacteraceae bacterium]